MQRQAKAHLQAFSAVDLRKGCLELGVINTEQAACTTSGERAQHCKDRFLTDPEQSWPYCVPILPQLLHQGHMAPSAWAVQDVTNGMAVTSWQHLLILLWHSMTKLRALLMQIATVTCGQVWLRSLQRTGAGST